MKYNYPRFKVRIAPDSNKIQGLRQGDIVRRQYADNIRTVYSLMVVLETGEEALESPEGILNSSYFVGALLEGDEPQNGELLDFVRVSSLIDPERCGAMYLTASDAEAPYMDVLDGVGMANSLCRPTAMGGEVNGQDIEHYTCKGSSFLSTEYRREEDGVQHIFRMTRNKSAAGADTFIGLQQNLAQKLANPQRVVLSYKIRASKPISTAITFGCTDDERMDGSDPISVTTAWQYHLTIITAEYPSTFRSVSLNLAASLVAGDWLEIAEMNVNLVSDISTFAGAMRVRVGKVSGIVDPLFGVLDGYGAYFQNLYATRNVSVAGTLTAGDEEGFSSTFYVGKIHKNCFRNSLQPKFVTEVVSTVGNPPAGVGKIYLLPIGSSTLECQSEQWALTHNGRQYCFSFWAYSSTPHTVTVEYGGEAVGVVDMTEQWMRYHVPIRTRHIIGESLQICLRGTQTSIFASPQLEAGMKPTLYQPTDDVLIETNEYGAWFSRGGIGGTIQNPLLKLTEDGSIRSANGSFVINADGTGYFAGGRFRWDNEHIELKDLTIDWSEVAEHMPKPVTLRAGIASSQPQIQTYYWESNSTVPSWATSPYLVLTPSLFVSGCGDVDQIMSLASDGVAGIKPGSVVWYWNDKEVISGQGQITIATTAGKYALTLKSNAIGAWNPQIRFVFTAIYMNANGEEIPFRTEKEFSLLTAPSSTTMAVMSTPDGVIFRDGAPSSLRLHCDMLRGSRVNDKQITYVWGVPDESIFANTQVAEAMAAGITQMKVRSTANMVPGAPIKIITTLYTITAVDHVSGTVSFTPATKGAHAVNAIVTCPDYNEILGAGWRAVDENNPCGTTAGWSTNELSVSPAAVAGGSQTFMCAIRDDNSNKENSFYGKVVSAMVSVSDLTVPDISSLDWVDEWNSGKTHIGGELVISPKIFAGVKHDDGLLTGVALGHFPLTMYNDAGTGLVVRDVDGICGFDRGRKVFSVESSGSVQLGYGNQSIRYNASTGQIEFGAGVSLAWTGAIATAKTEAINTAATTAQNKADAALNTAKGYADTKKAEALDSAATTAQGKADAALGSAKSYADSKKNEAITEAVQAADGKIGTLTAALNISIADARKAGTDARTIADAITAKAANEGWSTKLTYIDGAGIFTGALSTNTVKAITINASQIIAGVIDAARINVESLKTAILTAGNIEAMTLNVVRGTIGGWTLDADSIYRGTKNNTTGTFATVSSMTIGSNGIRGNTWRLDAIGTGAVAKGNIAWDAAGNVTFGEKVKLAWQSGIDTASELARAMAYGKMLFRDPTFSVGINGIKAYNNSKNDTVTIARVANPQAPNDSLQVLEIATTGTASPGLGGFYFANASAANKIFITRIIAKIPVGYQIYWTSNTAGTGRTIKCLTSAEGTGKWEEYVFKVVCGTEGSFLSTNFFYLDASLPVVYPVVWQVAYATVFDVTSAEKLTTTINGDGIYTGSLTAEQITTGILSADRIAAGSIKAEKLDAISIKASIINAEYVSGLNCTFAQGKIGGWTIGASTLSADHIVLDAVNKRLAVYGAGSNPVSGQRVQLYYSSDSDFGIYVTDAAGVCVASLGANNRIAGWAITTTTIAKGNVSLGADGSITNAAKWKLNNDGSGQLASGNILWDAAGAVTFSSAVSLAWITPISTITSALGGASYPKLTNISATGIYTGTLTAAQVNAVGINAGSITTGTLSVNRLDAVAIKSSIINTDYINGLSCSFVRGTIGGWTIGTDSIMVGTIGAVGQTPIQIRPNSSGNGYWYSGAYRPLGITMTWCQSNNAGHVVFGQVAAAGNAPKTGFVGIQMMGWDNTEYFCLSANYTLSGSKEVYNRIAGWAFDHDHIWKNSVSLGADGSVQNGTKWQLNNDGSGRVASGNIAWDAAGNVTFGASVSLAWTTEINAITTALGGTFYPKLTQITASGIYTGKISAGQINVDTTLVIGGAANNGSLSIRDASDNVRVTLDRAGITAVGGKIGGWLINQETIMANAPESGHRVCLASSGYLYNDNPNTGIDYWGLNPDGSATFGSGKILFQNDGSGYLANQNIKWDARGNVSLNGTITATTGKIAGFSISGNHLMNSASDSSIEFTSLIGNAFLYINSSSALISMRADSARTGINIETYATGARGMYILANVGSKYAIEAYGPMQLGQRYGERWCVPGVLYIGCKYAEGENNYYKKVWGDGATIKSFTYLGWGQYKISHNLGHLDYSVSVIGYGGSGYFGFFRINEKTTSYFIIQNLTSEGDGDTAAFDFIIMGRNYWY